MIPKYLYIDDESLDVTTSMLNGFNDTGMVSIKSLTLHQNEQFDDVSDAIIKECSQMQYNGVIIDLYLDGEGPNSLKFKAPPLAQQIRTLASEGKIPYMPIVLCSTAEKILFFDKDRASHDLFDFRFKKDDTVEEIVSKLHSLAIGYVKLNEIDESERFCAIVNRAPDSFIDNRVVECFSNDKLSPYDVAHLLKTDLIDHSGVLITEDIVASRMGVDVDSSGEGWEMLLKDISDDALYKGVFSSGWKRFWADLVCRFFASISGGTPYSILTADERVLILSESGYKGLFPARPIKYNKSSFFNTICDEYKKPLDSLEGIPIGESMLLKPWQERKYISFYAIAKGDYIDKLGVEGEKRYCDIKNRILNEEKEGE